MASVRGYRAIRSGTIFGVPFPFSSFCFRHTPSSYDAGAYPVLRYKHTPREEFSISSLRAGLRWAGLVDSDPRSAQAWSLALSLRRLPKMQRAPHQQRSTAARGDRLGVWRPPRADTLTAVAVYLTLRLSTAVTLSGPHWRELLAFVVRRCSLTIWTRLRLQKDRKTKQGPGSCFSARFSARAQCLVMS